MRVEVELLGGDACQLLGDLEAESMDLVIADPPYNLGKDYGHGKGALSADQYLDFSRAWLAQVNRVLRPGGTLYVFMGVRFISYIYAVLENELGLKFNSWITWHYTQGMGRKRGFSPRHEDILMFNKGGGAVFFDLDGVRIPQKYYRKRNNMRGANPGDVWEFSHVHYCQKNRQAHPTQKPEGLIERMVLGSSPRGGRVLDPFAGSGTTLRVCQQLGRHVLGMELNPDYLDLIKERLGQPFMGFDGLDPRLCRVPMDLRDPELRRDYLKRHRQWFLKNHKDALASFEAAVLEAYGPE
jgi:DNA modification methylase